MPVSPRCGNGMTDMADEETLPGDADATGPWTIKSVPAKLRRDIISEARKEGATVSVWLERRMAEWQTIIPTSAAQPESAPVHNSGRPAQLMLAAPVDHAEMVRLAMEMASRQDVPERDRAITLRAANVRLRRALRGGDEPKRRR